MDNSVNDYDYKPNFNYFKTEEEEADISKDLFVGWELEVENTSDIIDTYDVTSEISKIVNIFENQFVYYKHDGSLDDGVEIVSMPFTLNFIRENENKIKEMLDYLTENGYKSHETSTCGLHFHINKKFFGRKKEEQNKCINKLILFTEYFKDNVKKISRRRNYGYCTFLSDYCEEKGYNVDKKDFTNILRINKVKEYGNRYTAVNITNNDTVELRFFRGTLNFESFMAATEFVFSLAQVVKNKEITDISWDDVIDFEGNKYLKMYCIDRGVPTMSEKMKDYSLEYLKEQNKLKEKYIAMIEDLKSEIYLILKRNVNNQSEFVVKLQKTMPKKFSNRINKGKFESKFNKATEYMSFCNSLAGILIENDYKRVLDKISDLAYSITQYNYYEQILLKKEVEEFVKIRKKIKEIIVIRRKVDDSLCV